MKRILQRILLKLLPVESIERSIGELKIQRCNNNASLGKNSRFYEEARVMNFQGKKEKIVIGNDTHIRGDLVVFASGGMIELGNSCFVGEGTRIWSADNIKIGDHVLIAHNCNIIDTNSHEIDAYERAEGFKNIMTQGFPKEKGNIISSAIIIEDHAWISFNATILRGVRIGKGAIVAANSVVISNVEPFTMVAGNPASFVKNIQQKNPG